MSDAKRFAIIIGAWIVAIAAAYVGSVWVGYLCMFAAGLLTSLMRREA